jgi:hypothetical protein
VFQKKEIKTILFPKCKGRFGLGSNIFGLDINKIRHIEQKYAIMVIECSCLALTANGLLRAFKVECILFIDGAAARERLVFPSRVSVEAIS